MAVFDDVVESDFFAALRGAATRSDVMQLSKVDDFDGACVLDRTGFGFSCDGGRYRGGFTTFGSGFFYKDMKMSGGNGSEIISRNPSFAPSTAWCSEIGPLTSLDAPELHASSDVREPISLH